MSKSPSRRFPVTVTQLPVTRCQICHRTVAYRPGNLTEVLTEHYRRAHPEALELASRSPLTQTPGTTPQLSSPTSAGPGRPFPASESAEAETRRGKRRARAAVPARRDPLARARKLPGR